MTLADLKREMLKQLGVTQKATHESNHDEIVTAVNTAFQSLWIDIPPTSRTHYTKSEHEIELIPNRSRYTIPKWSTQSVLNPVKLASDGSHLKPIESEHVFHRFAEINLNCPAKRPIVYYIDRKGSNTADSVDTDILLAPAPPRLETLIVTVEKEAPHFERADFCADPATVVPIPHRYVESCLLPIAIYYLATTSYFFHKPDRLELIQTNYAQAMRRLGATDPRPATVSNSDQPNNV